MKARDRLAIQEILETMYLQTGMDCTEKSVRIEGRILDSDRFVRDVTFKNVACRMQNQPIKVLSRLLLLPSHTRR